MPDEQRFSRQIALFGAAGQKRIGDARVAIVGLGGLGSHLAQQFAYLGVSDAVLVDDDVITLSSLNRVVGAVPADVDRTPKVEVAKRVIEAVEPEANVVTRSLRVEASEVQELLGDRTVVFGGLDSDLARLKLTEISCRQKVPYFDLATDTGEEDGEPTYGGRIVLADGTRCLHCLGLLDEVEMRRESLDPDARRAHDEIYGIERDALSETGPAVVSVNGTVASLAVTEFIAFATGLGTPEPQLVYYGERRLIRRVVDEGDPSCPYCAMWRRTYDRST